MRGGLSGLGAKGLYDLKACFLNHVHGIAVRAKKHVRPGVAAVLMAAHEEPGTERRDALDDLPRAHFNDGDLGFLEVRRRDNGFALIVPGDSGAEMR